MRLTSGASTVDIDDGDFGLDLNPALGGISWVGSIGDFNFNIVSGLSTPQIGSLTAPHMALDGLITSFGGVGGELTVMLTQTGFTGTPMGLDAAMFLSMLDVDLGDAVEFESWVGTGDQPFEQTTLLSDLSGIYTTDTSDATKLGSMFSLTMIAKITHVPGGSRITIFNTEVEALPEPSMVAMWAGMGGCAALGAVIRRRKLNA